MSGTSGVTVEGLIGLLVVVTMVAVAVRFVRLPYTVALVLTGLALALLPDTPRFQLTPGIILTVFLPVLLFYGAYNLDASDLRAVFMPVSLLAIPGVVVTEANGGSALRQIPRVHVPDQVTAGHPDWLNRPGDDGRRYG